VWTLPEKQKLIDSILNKYPIPLVLLAERRHHSPSSFEILDGLQRLHTIVSFVENSFHTFDGRFFNVDEFTRAKEEREAGKFEEKLDAIKITRSEVARILDYILPISVIRNATEPEVTEIFDRINSYGHHLSDQERRQAGLIPGFAQFVRTTACELRGDVSIDTLPLYQMPEISVDLPKTKYGYTIQAEDVFWVRHGILRSTDLRDSLDEQVIADVTSCIISGKPIERSKDALDAIYDLADPESAKIAANFAAYGADRLRTEMKYCIETIDKICSPHRLRSIVFKTRTINPFPTVFSTIMLAMHDLSFKHNLVLADAAAAQGALENIQSRLNTRRDALGPDARRSNINVVKALLRDHFVTGDVSKIAFGVRRELDIENTLRRSQIETPTFELKQGILRLDGPRSRDDGVFLTVLQTICAIANIGRHSTGAVFVGVADDQVDADRICMLDGISPNQVGNRWVVGIDREAKILGITTERYYHLWREAIDRSALSPHLKTDVLSRLDLCIHKGVHILILTIPPQQTVSLLDGYIIRCKLNAPILATEVNQPRYWEYDGFLRTRGSKIFWTFEKREALGSDFFYFITEGRICGGNDNARLTLSGTYLTTG
jgi:hypothetical protein